jgi:glutamate racemase
MKPRGQKTTVLFAALLGLAVPVLAGADNPVPQAGQKLAAIFEKAKVTVAVTDSGLGGLSVLAEAARKVKEARIFAAADFAFFNALFSTEGGYNSLKTRQEKIAVFDSALDSLEKKSRPDVILIGCNTLSVLYEDTPFSKRTKTPVIGIVDPGVDLIAWNLASRPDSSVIIFGTPTTIAEETHKQRLMELGFSEQWIITQSCPELENFIEKDNGGEETAMLISGCVAEAVQRIPLPRPPLFVSLNCTHYGYSLPLWEKAFEESGIKPLAFLNPNSRMADVLARPEFSNRHPQTEISVRVISMVEIGRDQVDSLAKWLQETSPETAAALRNYDLEPTLFEWKTLIKR